MHTHAARRAGVTHPVVAVLAMAWLVASHLVGVATATTHVITVDGDLSEWSASDRIDDPVDPGAHPVDDGFTATAPGSTPSTWTIIDGAVTPGKDDLTAIWARTVLEASEQSLYFAWERRTSSGSADVLFELNQSTSGPWGRSSGDLLIEFDFDGNGQTDRVEITVATWSGSAWVGATSVGTDGAVDADGFRGEGRIDLATLFGEDDFACATFATLGARSATTSAGGGQLKDIVGPAQARLDTCGHATIEKEDAEGNALTGATFDVFAPGADPETDLPVATCTTPDCDLGDLPSGTYTVVETQAPVGYLLPDPAASPFEIVAFTSSTHTVTDERASYRLDVTPDVAVNPPGETHEFSVTLWTDDPRHDEYDPTWLTSDWTGTVGAVAADTCDTWSWVVDGSGWSSTCSVSVEVGDLDVGNGTLQASFDTPYQHHVVASEVGGTDGAGTVVSEAVKAWWGVAVTMDAPAVNELGDPHDFDVTVTWIDWAFVDDAWQSTEVASDGDTVHLTWVGPDGSTVNDDPDTATCVTSAGSCTVTVASSDSPGLGTLTVVGIDRVEGEALHEVDLTSAVGLSTTKTWVLPAIAYSIEVSPDVAVNAPGAAHVFTVHATASRFDESLEDVVLNTSWSGTVGTADAGCATLTWEETEAGTAEATCVIEVTVDSGDVGTGVLTATIGTGEFGAGDTDNGTELPITARGHKAWWGVAVDIDPPAVNTVGDPHTFTATVTYTDWTYNDGWTSTSTPSAGDTVHVTWSGPAGSSVNTESCTTAAGACTFTVSSSTTGTGTLTVVAVDRLQHEVTVDGLQVATTKTWVPAPPPPPPAAAAIGVTASSPPSVAVGDPVTFTYTVTNTGAQTLTGLTVVDDGGIPLTIATTTLAPGATTTVTSTVVSSEDDIPAISRTVTVTGTPGVGDAVTATASTVTAVLGSPSLTLDLSARITPDALGDKVVAYTEGAGSSVTYDYVITNSGAVTVSNLTLTDPLFGDLVTTVAPLAAGQQVRGSFALPLSATTLVVGGSTSTEATWTVTVADVVRGEILNTATATGIGPSGAIAEASDSERVVVTEVLGIVIDNPTPRPGPAPAPVQPPAPPPAAPVLPVTGVDALALFAAGLLALAFGALALQASPAAAPRRRGRFSHR